MRTIYSVSPKRPSPFNFSNNSLKNVTTLPCKMHKSVIFFHFFTHAEYQFAIRISCGSVLLRHGLNFSRAWWTLQLISGENDSVQKVVTMNICCNVACLTFHLPHITTDSFQSHQCQPRTGSFQIHQRLEECNIPSVKWQSYAFYKVMWWIKG